jgi:hypothetical protein
MHFLPVFIAFPTGPATTAAASAGIPTAGITTTGVASSRTAPAVTSVIRSLIVIRPFAGTIALVAIQLPRTKDGLPWWR